MPQADIKLNAYHCDNGFSNQLFTKACKPTGAAGDVMHEDDRTSLVSADADAVNSIHA